MPTGHIPNVQRDEFYADSEATRRAIAGKAAAELAQAVAVCGWFEKGKYARWIFKDRTGARPDVVIYRCYRPGGHHRGPVEAEVGDLFPGLGERLGPPFQAVYTNKPGGDDSPGLFCFRWECRWNSIEVPEVKSAAELKAAAEKRRAKKLAELHAQAEADRRASLFDNTDPLPEA